MKVCAYIIVLSGLVAFSASEAHARPPVVQGGGSGGFQAPLNPGNGGAPNVGGSANQGIGGVGNVGGGFNQGSVGTVIGVNVNNVPNLVSNPSFIIPSNNTSNTISAIPNIKDVTKLRSLNSALDMIVAEVDSRESVIYLPVEASSNGALVRRDDGVVEIVDNALAELAPGSAKDDANEEARIMTIKADERPQTAVTAESFIGRDLTALLNERIR